jgi:choice-of-anchor C domain-containing protein
LTGASNGSFEVGTFTTAPFDTLTAGSTAMTDWTVDSGSIDWIGSYWPASNGDRSIDLNGTDSGAISQILATTIGNTYVVTFDLSGNPEGPPSAKTLTVGATGAAPASYAYDTGLTGNTVADMMWAPQLPYSFLATSSSTVLSFASTIAGPFGPALDNVVVTENVPTANDCKNGGWATMIDTQGNSFKNQGDCVSFFATKGKNLGSVAPLPVAAPAPAATTGDTSPTTADVKRSTHTQVRSHASATKVHSHGTVTKAKTHGAKSHN